MTPAGVQVGQVWEAAAVTREGGMRTLTVVALAETGFYGQREPGARCVSSTGRTVTIAVRLLKPPRYRLVSGGGAT